MNKEKNTPTLANWLVSRSIPSLQLEEFMGDLHELYEERMETKGRFRASLFYWIDALHLMIGFSSISSLKIQNNRTTMLKSYFKITYRNLLKYKFFSAINVIGLAVGISMSLLIAIHVSNELSYETSYPKHENIYRLASTEWAKMPPLLATEFKEKMPEVKDVGRLFSFGPTAFKHEQKEILVERPFLGDASILEIFDIEFVEGTTNALDEPNSIVLTESVANRLFETGEKRIGETVTFDGGWKQTVTGIIKDFPRNTHLKIECITSANNSFITKNNSRTWSGVSIFTLFNSKSDAEKVAAKLLDFEVQFYDGLATREEIVAEVSLFELHPITDIHLHSQREKEIEANSNITFVYVFAALAIFILLVVIINFINLYVAQTLNRIKEIGLRKVMGAYRSQLIFQFLTEAFLLVITSGIIALAIAYFSLPFYNSLAAIPIYPNELLSTRLLSMLAMLILIVGSLAGGYPALYLSRFGVSEGLSNQALKINSKLPLRTAMVAFQFLISISLLSATLVVSKQMNFINSKDLGFAKEEVVAIRLHGKLVAEATQQIEKVRAELTNDANVSHVSLSSHLIGSRFSVEPFSLKSAPQNEINARMVVADVDFLETMGIEILTGGLESKSFTGRKYFFNETAQELLQQEDPLGETGINTWQENEGEVVGIVKDFHFASLHNEVDPLIIQLSNDDVNALRYLLVRIKSDDISSTIKTIEAKLNELVPGSLIISQLVDENMDLSYRAENSLFSIFKVFSSVIIGLACIGLFALFAFIAQAKTKEMGIRKTLGASLSQLLLIMTKSYMGILIVIAIIAIPLVQYFASTWLEGFAFRTSISWWYLILPGAFVLALAASAILLQSWKVASRNPVESLKHE